MKTLFVNTRLRVAFLLATIWIVYLFFHFTPQVFLLPLFSIVLVVFFDLLVTYIRKRTFYLASSSLVTGFLIGLILSPTEGLWIFVFACALAVLSKQCISFGAHKHIFNPAALGIFTTSLLFGVPVAWWAVSWSPWVILIIISIFYTLYRLRRLWLPITFLSVYVLYFFIIENRIVYSSFFDGTVFLFAFIMLPEPITSFAIGKWKYMFGPLVAVFAIVLGNLQTLPDVFLPALLLGNLIGFLAKHHKRLLKNFTGKVQLSVLGVK